ncbi:hypothetical protein [Pelomonas aquatica]|jgi:hypothetical protein|uniref:Uncharacterized protein n=2 Tax=Pseudomonadota TaxID=1224 RepID=A0A9X4R535_9BURK|nr:hypothetical protein [Pelomonas aquatica]MCY4756567.1 hypothetical protein [Pelomonas aquatica]MDG0863922.1 hypothetical protein [Pelomonas aquatica]
MRINALGLNSVRAAYLVLQEIQRQPGLPDELRAAAGAACIGYPSLAVIRLGLWTAESAQAQTWGAALMQARQSLDRLLTLDTDADIRDLARWANRHFPTRVQLAGHRVVHDPGRGWTLEIAA